MLKDNVYNWNYLLLLILSLVLVVLAVNNIKHPMTEVHWDTPIYAYHGKRFAETNYLSSFVQHSQEIAEQVRASSKKHRWPEYEGFPESYWHFIRLGNIVFLGLIYKAFGSSEEGLRISSIIYNVLFALAVLVAARASYSVNRLMEPEIPKTVILNGLFFSLIAYVMSDVYAYLGNNLVSEIPCIFFLALSVLLLSEGIFNHSFWRSILSGVFAFIAYFIRMDSIWIYLSFLLVLIFYFKHDNCKYVWWPGLLASGASALFLYSIYAWYFFPLANPLLFLEFSSIFNPKGTWALNRLVVAGGALWVGAFVGILLIRRSLSVQLAMVWMLLIILPWVPRLLWGSWGVQTRHFSVILLPLLLVSSRAWAGFLIHEYPRHRIFRTIVIFLTFGFIMVSQSGIYKRLLDFPGAWRLQLLRPYVSIPGREKTDYGLNELQQISNVIVKQKIPIVVVRSTSEEVWPSPPLAEALSLLRYFGTPYSPNADLSLVADPKNSIRCDEAVQDLRSEPVVFCVEYSESLKRRLLEEGISVLYLYRSGELQNASLATPENRLLATKSFLLLYKR